MCNPKLFAPQAGHTSHQYGDHRGGDDWIDDDRIGVINLSIQIFINYIPWYVTPIPNRGIPVTTLKT